MRSFLFAVFLLLVLAPAGPVPAQTIDPDAAFERIDDESPGTLGVYVLDRASGVEYTHNADRDWYLASTVKIPLAIAVLQRVEDGELSLDDTVTLRESDVVDGSGDLVDQEPGTAVTIRTLIEKMLQNSDSVATDMLVRTLGVDSFNEQVQDRIMGPGIGPITSILQVRYEAYGTMHENAERLTNADILELRAAALGPERRALLVEKMGVDESDLKVPTIGEAFEQYYEEDLNSGRLGAMGTLLEDLIDEEHLSAEHTTFLLDTMEGVTTGDNRIKAGLPSGVRFAHKTGTQIRRACNVGVAFPEPDSRERAVVVAACIEKFKGLPAAEAALERVGRVVGELIQDAS